jgi:hypothetical protein
MLEPNLNKKCRYIYIYIYIYILGFCLFLVVQTDILGTLPVCGQARLSL